MGDYICTSANQCQICRSRATRPLLKEVPCPRRTRLARPLDRSWWRRVNDGTGDYEQQDGYGRLVRTTEGWVLYIGGDARGSRKLLCEARQLAFDLTRENSHGE